MIFYYQSITPRIQFSDLTLFMIQAHSMIIFNPNTYVCGLDTNIHLCNVSSTFSFHLVEIILIKFFLWLLCISGVHRYLHSWNVCQADSDGSILLLPGGLEYLWWLHCEPEFGGAGAGWCRGAVCAQILQIGALWVKTCSCTCFYIIDSTKLY